MDGGRLIVHLNEVVPFADYVMVNVRAARRYGIYRSFSRLDEGGARVWYVKTTEGISRIYAPRLRTLTFL